MKIIPRRRKGMVGVEADTTTVVTNKDMVASRAARKATAVAVVETTMAAASGITKPTQRSQTTRI